MTFDEEPPAEAVGSRTTPFMSGIAHVRVSSPTIFSSPGPAKNSRPSPYEWRRRKRRLRKAPRACLASHHTPLCTSEQSSSCKDLDRKNSFYSSLLVLSCTSRSFWVMAFLFVDGERMRPATTSSCISTVVFAHPTTVWMHRPRSMPWGLAVGSIGQPGPSTIHDVVCSRSAPTHYKARRPSFLGGTARIVVLLLLVLLLGAAARCCSRVPVETSRLK
jgi:hypothetical protein